MRIAIEKHEPASAAAWDRAFAACLHATWFQSREWVEAWTRCSNGTTRAAPVAITFTDGKSAVVPLAVATSYRRLVKSWLSGPAGTYGGWISADALDAEHAAVVSDYLYERHAELYWRLNPYDTTLDPTRLRGVSPDETDALLLAQGFEHVRRNLSKGHASAVRKAQREGVTVRSAASEQDWRDYFAVYEDSLRRWGDSASSRYPWCLFDELRRLASPHVRLWLAEHSGRVVAGALCFSSARIVVYWHGAALEQFFPVHPVHYLLHEAIRDACERGHEWFDFNPSGGHASLRVFKRGFGTQVLSSPVVQRHGSWANAVGLLARTFRRVAP